MSNNNNNKNVNWNFYAQIAWDCDKLVRDIMSMAITFNAHNHGIIGDKAGNKNEPFMLSAIPQKPGNGHWDLHLIAPLNALMACAALLEGWDMELNEDEQSIIMC